MTYQSALEQIKVAAMQRRLGIKTYCLIWLGCATVPEAVAKLCQASQ